MTPEVISGIALLSWVAGTFESEGTVTITRSGKRGYTRPLVVLTSTDREMVDVFQRRWTGQIKVHRPNKPNARPAFVWTLNVRRNIARFLSDVAPFLRTERVRSKAALVMEDIGARVQGARGADYLAACHERREAIRRLNQRGTGLL